jgi:hypothetical protein
MGAGEGYLILYVGLSPIWVHMLLFWATLHLHWLRSAPSTNRSCVLHWYIQALREYSWSEPSCAKDKMLGAVLPLSYVHGVVLKYSQYYVTCTLRILMPQKAVFTYPSICCVFSCTAVPSNTQWCIHCACSCLEWVCGRWKGVWPCFDRWKPQGPPFWSPVTLLWAAVVYLALITPSVTWCCVCDCVKKTVLDIYICIILPESSEFCL